MFRETTYDEKEEQAYEQAYEQGNRAAWLVITQVGLANLGADISDIAKQRWIIEREETVALLRMICREYGDNDWPDNLHLTDIIEKHLYNYLEEKKG